MKPNHERNVALVHPSMFLTRRLIYAVLIVGFATYMLTSVLILMAMSLVMLGYALYEH